MPTTATRLITLILMLQRKPGQKAADLASQLGVSVRTLHRYFGMLDEMGVPVYAERGPYGGFSLVPGYKLPPLIFTPEEAVVLSLGTGLVREMWGQTFFDAAQGARAKLMNVLPAEQRQEVNWAENTLVTTGINRADMQMLVPRLDTLRTAARGGQRISMTYQSGRNPAGEQREVDTYGLFHRSGWWYAVGYCHLRKEIRTFRVDRILEVTLTDHLFSRPDDFDFRAYIAKDWQDVPGTRVKMQFTPQMAHLAQYARGYWETMEDHPDGSVTVTFNAPDLYAAVSHALSYGPGVTVLEPPEVRQMVREWAGSITGLYADESAPDDTDKLNSYQNGDME
ncbi:MAG: YafY family transcriptional regulator [Chloroflexi bacterium]|jgi:predicted DNA-binding transcriptional regulator YafY|nr:YafY family transcriptional regulator [Chloroflexota bacterium]BCY16392.1 repressor [Leptolinea sp. HRD-7]